MTLTPSEMRVSSVGWWMLVSTTVPSMRELAAAGDFQRTSQLNGTVVKRCDSLGADHIGPADEGGVVGRSLQIEPRELPQDDGIVDESLGLRVAPSVKPLDYEHPQDHLHGRGMPSNCAGVGMASEQIGLHEVEQLRRHRAVRRGGRVRARTEGSSLGTISKRFTGSYRSTIMVVAPLLWRFLGIRILQERPISHRKLSRRQVLPINGWGKDLEMFTNLGYVSTKVLRVALGRGAGRYPGGAYGCGLVAATSGHLGQRGRAPAQPLYEVHDLGTLAGGSFSYAFGINEAGKVVGAAATSNNEVHAFLYSGGQMQDLGTLGGSFSRAVDINEAGKAVGASTTSGDAQQHTFLYSRGQMQDLGTLAEPYNSHSFATALNNKGEVVGQSGLIPMEI